ncbi:glycoside hydrolase family 3 N-terminal domain-containing protein [Neobacillus terrae]|uniref:glycoside hydrolase family 3 N-terminal domain-containing protein n=1 Tax=Neobacillus terrae TaxID=3034837 RepID=UPI00140A7D3A|nr:hypothetical protein [Neobacillus terrae]
MAHGNINPTNPLIGIRSFGEKTNLVSQIITAQIKGYQQNGLLATANHFPGHIISFTYDMVPHYLC